MSYLRDMLARVDELARILPISLPPLPRSKRGRTGPRRARHRNLRHVSRRVRRKHRRAAGC